MRSLYYTNKSSERILDRGSFVDDALNALPAICEKCGFVDLNYLPKKYRLLRRLCAIPVEVTEAAVGNLLVKDRVVQILKTVAGKQCQFKPTYFHDSDEKSPWTLIVPRNAVELNRVGKKTRRCKSCSQPNTAHPGSQFDNWLAISETDPAYGLTNKASEDLKLTATSTRTRYTACRETDFDFFKSLDWHSLATSGIARWTTVDRQCFVSVRLLELFRLCKVKSSMRADTRDRSIKANDEELAWAQKKLAALGKKGVSMTPAGEVSAEDLDWLKQFVKEHKPKQKPAADAAPFEKKHKLKLPKSYKDFVKAIGSQRFEDVDGEEGFTATILLPNKINVKDFRHGNTKHCDGVSVDAVMFVATGHGDGFCFDLDPAKPEAEVLYYNHEYDWLEPYAANFAACVRRFASD